MFRPNSTCQINQSLGQGDLYGMPTPSVKKTEGCAVVEMNIINAKSSVRSDTSASRGNAMELETTSTFLLTKNTVAKIDDTLIYDGLEFRISGMFPRKDILGKLDHYQVTCTYWGTR